MIVCHSMSYLSFSFCAFDTARRNLALDVLVFQCSLKVRNPFFMGWHDAKAW